MLTIKVTRKVQNEYWRTVPLMIKLDEKKAKVNPSILKIGKRVSLADSQ
jgi:hypothetical protein